MLRQQNFKCAVCGVDSKKLPRRLSVDHDHNTKAIRGLLCYKCNMAIGLVNESPTILDAMKAYLQKYKIA
jgi:hypothetical protein